MKSVTVLLPLLFMCAIDAFSVSPSSRATINQNHFKTLLKMSENEGKASDPAPSSDGTVYDDEVRVKGSMHSFVENDTEPNLS